jgi:hypothetical protein
MSRTTISQAENSSRDKLHEETRAVRPHQSQLHQLCDFFCSLRENQDSIDSEIQNGHSDYVRCCEQNFFGDIFKLINEIEMY